MINAEDEILVDFSTSCTKDVAVAKMLGWMQGYRRNKVVMYSEYGILADQFPHLYSLDDTLVEQLLELRKPASQEFIGACKQFTPEEIREEKDESGKDTPYEILKEKEKVVAEWDALIDKAGFYLLAIEEELDKGESSKLKIDQEATKNSGHTHLTINSVDQWARRKYGISIMGTTESEPLAEDSPEQPQSTRQEQEADCKGGLSKTTARHLYTTLAFLVDAFSRTAPRYKYGTGPNNKGIAQELEKLATEANNNKPLLGQGYEAIMTRIEDAIKTKESKLPQR